MKQVAKTILTSSLSVACLLALLTAPAAADPGNEYCITPPFITAGVKPNLLLMLDNSASMYDLAYQDTANRYCSNAPTTACTTDSTCSAIAATCRTSGTTVSSTQYSAEPCTSNAQCTAPGSSCRSGFCTKCNTNTGAGDCVSTTTTSFTAATCTSDATCNALTAGDTCNNKCSVSRQCYDNTYSNGTTYTGYFNENDTYAFDFGLQKFVTGATFPASCDYSAGSPRYVCVNTNGTGTTSEVVTPDATGFVAKGNFLNWLATSKFDVEKEILTGGKFENSALVAETRGCAGRKFIKTVSATTSAGTSTGLNFAIRGGTPGGLSRTQSQAAEYGETFIDLSTGIYNASACLSAMDNWMQVTTPNPPQLGTFQNNTRACVGAEGTVAESVTAVSVWNHILHNCYQGLTPGSLGYSTNLGPLLIECKNIYASVLPASMTDPNAGYAVCSSAITYVTGGVGRTGYLGYCWNGTNFTTKCTEAQLVERMRDYCEVNVTTNPVADPSSTTIGTAGASAPGFILEQGLLSTQPVGTFPVKIQLATPPTGLIDTYKDRIRFGVMSFQNNGSGTECGNTPGVPCFKTCSTTSTRICYFDSDCPTGETCGALPKRDGGEIKAYVGAGRCSVGTGTACTVDADCAGLTPAGQYCEDQAGNHTSGLVREIDRIPATSWTPFAEAFYNAIGYFARTNTYSQTPPTSRSDANFSELAAPNTVTNYVTDKNPSQFRCQSNNVLLITDGMSTADKNSAVEDFASLYAPVAPNTVAGVTSYGQSGYDSANSCPPYGGSRSISTLSWVARNRGIKALVTSGTRSTAPPANSSEAISTYVVYSGPQTSNQPGLCDPKTLMDNTAKNGGTTLFSATNPSQLYAQIDAAFSTVAAKAASGTAASILSNSEGSGANILQAVFYPRKNFDSSTAVSWIGEMQNLWYYVDPFIQNSTIREDTVIDKKLNLKEDRVVRFAFDASSDRTMVQRLSDADGNGVVTDADKVGGLIDPDYVGSIWRAGMRLWKRSDSGTTQRTIYTGYNSSADGTPQKFSNLVADGALNTLPDVWSKLQIPAGTNAQREALATKLISYVRGTDQPNDTAPCLNADCSYRNRRVTMGYCSTNDQMRCTAATVAADCPPATSGTLSCNALHSEWKLGDIISSTPRVQSSVRLNSFDFAPPGGYNDKSYEGYINSNNYENRGMVYVGANDGMLHAFTLGKLSVKARGFEKASLAGTDLGSEKWAFIPKNSLPYLKYFTDPNYAHLYFVDGRTVLLDASVGDTNSGTCVRSTYWDCPKPRSGSVAVVDSDNNLDATTNTWRTILIGGMGLGGASRNSDVNCTPGAAGNCVKTPVDGIGFSSYFALDVTAPDNPKFLWEFSDPDMGYATTAPAIVRVGDKDKNGRWFAVFGSGPLGPIDTGSHQFKGESNQHLRVFVVDLRTGELVRTMVMNGTGGNPTIENAFAGTLMAGAVDTDRRDPTKVGNYQDDAVYLGYVKRGPAAGDKWTDGGVLRVMTKEDTNPANWVASKVIEGVGPVTTSIARVQDVRPTVKKLWLYFGTGRYYYRDATSLDDNDSPRSLFGIQEPCYNTATSPGNVLDKECTTTLAANTLVNQTNSVSALGLLNKGWRIDLDAASGAEGAERVVTDTVALTNGTVFFTSFKPVLDICGYGGNSYLWGVNYATGGAAASNALRGKALIQLSTGEFKEVDLSTAFTSKLDRRMLAPMTGKPPSDAPPIVSNSSNRPVKKILHIREH